jgi:hypothetical protein
MQAGSVISFAISTRGHMLVGVRLGGRGERRTLLATSGVERERER